MKRTIFGALLASGLAMSLSAYAAPVDLTTAGDSGVIGGATYTQVDAQPTGTGFIDSFVEIGGANKSVVQAYNTTVNGTFDNGSSPTFNHEITVGTIGFIETDAGLVMRFLLDINQTSNPQGASLFSLDEVQIFISTDANLSTEAFPLALGTLVYQMDAADDEHVMLDYDLNHGSGSGDMTLDIPFALFNAAFGLGGFDTADAQNGAFIYLYSRFGEIEANNDGFEEWAYEKGADIEEPCPTNDPECNPTDIPEPGSLSLLALGLLGAAVASRRRSRRM
jgi:hypothetical protein